MSKILIIGGSGYLGWHLSKVLIKKNDVFITSRYKREEQNSLVFDLEDSSTYNNIDFNSFDIVFMLASSMSGIQSKTLDGDTFNLNCIAYKDFLNHLVEINYAKRFVYISSMTVYSDENSIPVEENGLTELPPNPYGLSKLLAEQLTKFYCREHNFKGAIIRIPGLFGGDRKSGFIYNAVDKISKNEDFFILTENLKYWETISVLDVSDMIQVFIDSYNWEQDCEVYNICYGNETDIIELAYFIKEYFNSTSNITSTSPKGYKPFYLSNKKYLNLTNNYPNNFKDSLVTYINTIIE
jgi:nucleoside-diphosphate-sugar epimerase